MESASGGQLLAETDFGGVQGNAHLPKRSRISAAWRVEIYGRTKNISRTVRRESDGIRIEWGTAAEVVRLCQRLDIARLPKTPTIMLTMRIRTDDAVAFDSAFGWAAIMPHAGADRLASFDDIDMIDGRTLEAKSLVLGSALHDPIDLAIAFKPEVGAVSVSTIEIVASEYCEPIAAPASAPPDSSPPGKLEVAEPQRVRGWVKIEESGVDPIVSLYLNDTRYFTGPAAKDRGDLQRAGLDGKGFETRILLRSNRVGRDIVTLRVGDKVLGKPLTVTGLPAHLKSVHEIATARKLLAMRAPTVSIVVPAYNAADDLRACLESLIRHTAIANVEAIVIDDASTDPGVADVFASFADVRGFRFYRNDRNLGFSGTVNRGIDLAGSNDVVLLNADTRVTPGWLASLQLAAHIDHNVASATAVSDNAGVFSVPLGDELSGEWSDEEKGRLVTQASGAMFFDVPTCHGFCVYLRRDALDDVGVFDQAAFPEGYGEENDWSMRAGHRGWHHVVSDRTLVLHRRGSSFGERRKSLLKQGRAIVDGRFPEYQSLVAPLRTAPTFLTLNYRLRAAAAEYAATAKRPKPRILYVISSRTGGTPQTNRDLMQALSDDHDVFLLTCEKTEMHLHRLVDGDLVSIDSHDLKRPVDVKTHRLREYDDVVTAWLIYNAIEIVHVRHIAWHSLGLIDAAKDLNLGVVFSFHDYYVACPTVKLLDNNLSYCGGTCTAGDGYCVPALWKLETVPHLKHSWVNRWRDIMAAALRKCDAFVTTVDSAFAVVAEIFPFITSVPNVVIPHGRDFDTLTLSAAPMCSGEPLRIAVPGNISDAKGAGLIAGVKALDRDNRIEFHIFGKHSRTLDGVDVVRHGLYARDDLGSLIAAANIHIGGVFSVWPETYCHTLTELWASGLPVVGFDSGAVGERIAASGAGWLFDDPTPEALFDLLLRVAGDDAERTARIDAVARWQETIGRHHGTARMGDGYRTVYETVRDRMLNFTTEHSTIPAQSSQEFEPERRILELAQ